MWYPPEKGKSLIQLFGSPWIIQNNGVGSLSLLQGIFPTQGSNPGLPHLQADSLPAEPQGSPRILEWVAYPFSSGSSQPRDQIGFSCIAGGFFNNWAVKESLIPSCLSSNIDYWNLN